MSLFLGILRLSSSALKPWKACADHVFLAIHPYRHRCPPRVASGDCTSLLRPRDVRQGRGQDSSAEGYGENPPKAGYEGRESLDELLLLGSAAFTGDEYEAGDGNYWICRLAGLCDRVTQTVGHSTVERFRGGAKTPTGLGVWFLSYIFHGFARKRRKPGRRGNFPESWIKEPITPRIRTDRQAHRQDDVVDE